MNTPRVWICLLLALLALAACRSAPAEPTQTPPQPDTILTAAAQTAEVRLTQAAAAPTATPPPPPTSTATPSPEPAESVTPTLLPATPTTGVQVTVPAGPDQALFEADVTVPDGTTFAPGEAFRKTWKLKNVGTSTWTTEYDLVFLSGVQMAGAAATPLSNQVLPGESIEVSVSLTAPETAGNHRGFWILRNASDQTFQSSFFVDINVSGSGSQTGNPTPTPGSTGSGTVTGVSLTVDSGSYTGSCPHTFNFTAQVTLSNAANVTLQLEAGSDTPGFQFTLPPPETRALPAGDSFFAYSLNISNSVSGWARVRVTLPENVASNQVNFTLTCE